MGTWALQTQHSSSYTQSTALNQAKLMLLVVNLASDRTGLATTVWLAWRCTSCCIQNKLSQPPRWAHCQKQTCGCSAFVVKVAPLTFVRCHHEAWQIYMPPAIAWKCRNLGMTKCSRVPDNHSRHVRAQIQVCANAQNIEVPRVALLHEPRRHPGAAPCILTESSSSSRQPIARIPTD